MKIFAFLTLGMALCALPAFSQAGAAAAASPPAPLVIPPAFTEKGDMSFEGFGGVNSSGVDRDPVQTAAGSAGVRAAWGIGHKMALTGTFLYDDIGKTGGFSVTAKEFEIGVQRVLRQRGRIEPYLRLDAGGVHQHLRIEGFAVLNGATQFAVAPGLGILVPLTRFFAFDFGVRAVVPVQPNPLPWQIQGLVGFVFRKPAGR
jgi:hypothetical protein